MTREREIIQRLVSSGMVADWHHMGSEGIYCFFCSMDLPDRKPRKASLSDPEFHQPDCPYVAALGYLNEEPKP